MYLTFCNPVGCSTPGFPRSFIVSWSLLKFMSTEWMMPSNHLILCRPSSTFYIHFHSHLFWCSSFLPVDPSFFKDHVHSAWRTANSICYSSGLLLTNCISFYLIVSLFHPYCLKIYFSAYKILAWQHFLSVEKIYCLTAFWLLYFYKKLPNIDSVIFL